MGIVSMWGGTLQDQPFARPSGVVLGGWGGGGGATVKTKLYLGSVGRL